jgi:hypothetical protein
MTPAAPRIDSRLIAALERLDDPTTPIAETNRRVGALARRLELVKPSYEQVRTYVHAARRRGRHPGVGDVLLGVALNIRPPSSVMDYLIDAAPYSRSA